MSIISTEIKTVIPKGFMIVTRRYAENANGIPLPSGHNVKSHLYTGSFDHPGVPMCKNTPLGSILRNWESKKGLCVNCLNLANGHLLEQEIRETVKGFGRSKLTKNEEFLIDQYRNSKTHRIYVVNEKGPYYGTVAVTIR